MADRSTSGQALILVTLLLFSSWASTLDWSPQRGDGVTLDEVNPSHVGAGESTDLTLSSMMNSNLKLDLPADEPLTGAELNFKPKILPTQSGFVWDDATDWTHPDAMVNGTSVSDGRLTASSSGSLWDFNANNQGWTFSNSFAARVTSPACGFNGSSGGSVRTYGGSTYATSPTINLAGGANIPFHAWVHEGRSGCGETPDTNENLQFQYKASTGGWTAFKTFNGGGAQTSNLQYMTMLPAAAIHANSQFRIHQTTGSGGSGTCCDFWFVDDVHIATPPESNWTSPSLGHATGVTQFLADDTYSPLYIDAQIPSGAYLNWSILDSSGEVVPGMEGTNQATVPVDLLDHNEIDEFRLHLEFKGSSAGIPTVSSITGDGARMESFQEPPSERGWELNGSSFIDDAPSNLTATGCGIDGSLAEIESFAEYPVFNLSQSFQGTMILKCNPLGMTARAQWSILDNSGMIVAQGSSQLTPTNRASSAYSSFNIFSTQLNSTVPKDYTLETVYQLRQSSGSFYVPVAWSNTSFSTVNWSGTGTNPLYAPNACISDVSKSSVDVFSNKDSYYRKEQVNLVVFGACYPSNTFPSTRASWELVGPTGVVLHSGQISRTSPNLVVSRAINGLSLVNAIPGINTVNVQLEALNPSTSQWFTLDTSTVDITVDSKLDKTVHGGAFDSLTSPWFLGSSTLYDIEIDATATNAQFEIRHHPLQPWTVVTLPHNPTLDGESVGVQMRVSALPPADGNMSNFSYWYIEDTELGLYGGQVPSQAGLDVNLDGRFEWGRDEPRVGSWGWQDRFGNADEQVELTLTTGSPSVVKALVPSDDLTSFGFGYYVESGQINDVALFVQNTPIANYSSSNSADTFVLTPLEFTNLVTELSTVGTTISVAGTEFTEVRIEISGQGTATLGGLRASYNASHNFVADADSAFVMNLNQVRTSVPDIGGIQSVSLPFLATERGGLTVEVVQLDTSTTVVLQSGGMQDAESVLTPSQKWQTITTEYDVFGSSIAHHRLDVFSVNHQAVWLFPAAGGAPIGLLDSSLVEVHPTMPIESSVDGTTVTTNITFRMRPMWDDEMLLTATSRLVLQNGVIGIPYSNTWGDFSSQGYENDLEIKSVEFSNQFGLFAPNRQYLKGGEQMNLSVNIGFEGRSTNEAFQDGDARLTLYRDGTELFNTTSIDENYWNSTLNIPFTYADVTWTIGFEALNGSTILEPVEISRTFTVDSVKPRVMSSSVERFDHRTPSPTQVLQVTITDQPVLPTNVNAMVWKEWVDDSNLNGWPDEGEYNPQSMLLPSDLTGLTGVYTLMLDDTAASLGQKVAVYVEGTDPSGYSIVDGGSSDEGQQLFVYQLAVDGAPSLEADAFSWQDGRKAWLHPAQPYELDIKITEPNGGSDLATVEVKLAHNQGSDPMSIVWDFNTGSCTTESIHIIISDCEMLGADGPASPFEKDMLLNIEMEFGWNTPDLGDNRREPSIRVVDRAGQESVKIFPEHRWRFSAGLGVPDETVSLFLTSGSFLGDGARVTPLTQMEVSGAVEFVETHTIPEFNCDVEVLFGGQTARATAIEGIWSVELQAPVVSGSFSLTWNVACLEGQGMDLTDKENSVRWIRVDGTGPEPIEVLSPRPMAILGGENHEVRVVLEELGGLDVQSLELVWRVEDFLTGDTLRSGRVPMNLLGDEIDGNYLEVYANMDLTEITDEMMLDRMVVSIRIDGRDLAGNDVLSIGGEPSGLMISTWNMEWLQPKFELSPSALSYSRLLIDVGETTSVQLEVENTGSLAGSIDVIFESVEFDGTRELIQRTSVTAEAGSIGLVTLDWGPSRPGVQWVVATLENGETSSGPTVDVRAAEEPSFGEKVFGDVNPIIGTITGLLFFSVIITLLVMMKRMTANQGSKISYDWDEYSSELEDDEDDDYEDDEDDDDSDAGSTQQSDGALETDWVKGADGYWWYHDKATNEWWYKDADGEIVKHP